MTNNTKNKQYFALLTSEDGKFKVELAKELKGVNQFKKTWQRVDARELARSLNRKGLVIK